MTPFKLRPRFPPSVSGLSDSEFDDEPMVSSPPRSGLIPPIKQTQLPSANLFGDVAPAAPLTAKKSQQRRRFTPRSSSNNSNTNSNYSNSNYNSQNSTILRTLDLNAEATLSPSGSSTPRPSQTPRRKRQSDANVPAGREDVAYEDSDEDMFSSPVKQHAYRASPNCYRTLDGRTVTSKNPFSPFTPMDTADGAEDAYSPQHNMGTAPTMPESLSLSRQSSSGFSSPGITLSQRTPSIGASFNSGGQSYFGPSKNGFPDQQGRYSFTGSPIEEVDASLFVDHANRTHNHAGRPAMYGNHNNKIRRLQEGNDVAARPRKNQLFVHTEGEDSSCGGSINSSASTGSMRNPYRRQAPANDGNDSISPTDVFSFFPAAPPTPVKAGRGGNSSYTPLRIMQAPSTPTRRRRGSPHDHDEDDHSGDENLFLPSDSQSKKSRQQPQSRFHNDFDVIGQLGVGSFGTVYKCLSRLDGCMYAVKAAKRKAKGQADRDRMMKEVYALAALSDQADTAAFHIVRYHQAWMEENRLYIQTELCSCTLQNENQRGILASVPRRYKLLRELCVALEFIHRHGMVHLDIKPENIFVKNDQYKLGDFGLVHKSVTSDGGGCNDDVEEGDSRYMSMELLSGEFKDLTKSDIFSMGATMYEICLGRDLPMDGQEWQDIRSGSLQPMTGPNTPFVMELIIKEMMHPDPDKRPHPSQLLKKNELLSDEQKQLLAEKQKVFAVNMALALQTERMKKLTPPRPGGGLTRANTWNGSLPKWM